MIYKKLTDIPTDVLSCKNLNKIDELDPSLADGYK